eukprot:6204501-Amphidinium_carterae.1
MQSIWLSVEDRRRAVQEIEARGFNYPVWVNAEAVNDGLVIVQRFHQVPSAAELEILIQRAKRWAMAEPLRLVSFT